MKMEKKYILKATKDSIIVYSGPMDSLPRFNEVVFDFFFEIISGDIDSNFISYFMNNKIKHENIL